MSYTVGSVPYLNAKPLVRMFEEMGDESPVKVLYDVPSNLPKMLADGTVQAIMVSSIEAMRWPGKRIAKGVCIGTQNDVMSVRIFSKVPPKKIETLALDKSSMTSNALARIILKERYDSAPEVSYMLPNLQEMLKEHDACVLIGDNGMREEGHGLHVLDLGHEWHRLKGLPFVWAVWLGDDGLDPILAKHLVSAELWGRANIDRVLATAPAETGLPFHVCERYLHHIMHYHLDERELQGMKEFGKELHKFGLVDPVHFPALIAPDFSEELKIAKEHGASWAVNHNQLV